MKIKKEGIFKRSKYIIINMKRLIFVQPTINPILSTLPVPVARKRVLQTKVTHWLH